MLFPRDLGRKSKENLGQLCVKTLNKYKKTLEMFKKYLNNECHQFSIIKANDFKNIVESAEKIKFKFSKTNLRKSKKKNNFSLSSLNVIFKLIIIE